MRNGRRIRGIGIGNVVLLLLFISGSQGASTADAVTIVNNGDPANRVDLAILGEGYTAAELGKYADDVQQLVERFFAQEPFQDYQRYFNVHRIDVISQEAGADHPAENPPVLRDTAFDATYSCAGIQRLICVNLSNVLSVVSSRLPPTQRDLLLVLVNDPEYGGSGGAIAVASTHPDVVELVLHELGHSFGLLADEYGGPPPPACNASIEPPEPNVTRRTQRALIKWTDWIDLSTPIPTPTTHPGIPGLYEGAKYCDDGLFRPTYNSKMRSLGVPFEHINTDQLIKRIYNWVSPLEASTPGSSDVRLTQGKPQMFGVTTPAPLTQALDVTWVVNGQPQGTGGSVSV
jgi:IgA Peptidase M64